MWDASEMSVGPEQLAAAAKATRFTGTTGDDRLVGTVGRDTFDVFQGGDDSVRGEDGNDTFVFGNAFTHADVVKGGLGNDKVVIAGDYASVVELDPAQLRQVETVIFEGNIFTYSVVIGDGFGDIRVDGRDAGDMNVDASGLTTGSVRLAGGFGFDTLTGGAGDDRIRGGAFGDLLTGGAWADRFIFLSIADSEDKIFSNAADTIADFSPEDVILLPTGAGTGSANLDQYHIGQTIGRVGDVTASFAPAESRTVVHVFVDDDDIPDMTIYLTGDKSQLEISHDSRLVLADWT